MEEDVIKKPIEETLQDRIEELQVDLFESKETIQKLQEIIDLMAAYIDAVDVKSLHCAGYICTVATTAYPPKERRIICSNCIKRHFENIWLMESNKWKRDDANEKEDDKKRD